MTTRTDEKYVGRYYGERRIEITPDLVAHYASAVQDQNPWYFGASPFGGPVAPALILHSEVYHTIDWYLSYFGNLHARQEFEFFAPIMVGDTVTARRQIVERYLKRDREYVVLEVGCYDDDGRLLNRGRTHQSFVNKSAGVVVDKDREKRADRRFDVEQAGALETIAGPGARDHDRDVPALLRPAQELPQRRGGGAQARLPGHRCAGDDVALLRLGDDD